MSGSVSLPEAVIDAMLPGQRAILVIAHPGHELRLHGWLERARPTVCVLTDGSGHSARSRLASTSAIVARTGARPGAVYGPLTDRAVYDAILGGDAALFAELAEKIAESLLTEDADYVVADALEGYNPAHDLCRVLTEAAVELAARRGRRVRCFDFPLTGRPDAWPVAAHGATVTLTLGETAFVRKLAAARSYPELAGEVAAAVSDATAEAFRHECLRPLPPGPSRGAPPEDPPFYERHGERQVAAGRYRQVLRWRAHVAPLVHAILDRLGLNGR